MSTRTISVSLSVDDLDNTLRELDAYKQELRYKCELLREKIAERIAWNAEQGFSVADPDDWIGESAPSPNVSVSVKNDGDLSIVFADGEDAVFLEFGAGVTHNVSAGYSPHPWGAEHGFTIGGYGLGQGKLDFWMFRGEDGKYHITRGTPASMPMYHAVRDACDAIVDIAGEVFGA